MTTASKSQCVPVHCSHHPCSVTGRATGGAAGGQAAGAAGRGQRGSLLAAARECAPEPGARGPVQGVDPIMMISLPQQSWCWLRGPDVAGCYHRAEASFQHSGRSIQCQACLLSQPVCTQHSDDNSRQALHKNCLQAQAAQADAEALLPAMRSQLDAAQQAQAQAEASAAHAQLAAGEAGRRLDERTSDVHALTAELQQSRSSQHDASLHVERVQQQLDESERHRCCLILAAVPPCVAAGRCLHYC